MQRLAISLTKVLKTLRYHRLEPTQGELAQGPGPLQAALEVP